VVVLLIEDALSPMAIEGAPFGEGTEPGAPVTLTTTPPAPTPAVTPANKAWDVSGGIEWLPWGLLGGPATIAGVGPYAALHRRVGEDWRLGARIVGTFWPSLTTSSNGTDVITGDAAEALVVAEGAYVVPLSERLELDLVLGAGVAYKSLTTQLHFAPSVDGQPETHSGWEPAGRLGASMAYRLGDASLFGAIGFDARLARVTVTPPAVGVFAPPGGGGTASQEVTDPGLIAPYLQLGFGWRIF
jgi:hypothetical protein